ncbi:MAG: hypothetical protein Q9164_002748 [Protoblastenia rupestris]
MASNILSRFLPPAVGEPSIYEALRQHDDESDQSDVEDRAGMAIDEENLGERFRDSELDDEAGDIERVSGPFNNPRPREPTHSNIIQSTNTGKRKEMEDIDNEVPQSLLIEDDQDVERDRHLREDVSLPPPIPGPSSRTIRAKWQTTQQKQRLHNDLHTPRLQPGLPARRGRPLGLTDPRERATWMWANVENLDQFLNEVYDYFVGHGIWSILLSRIVKLL